MTVSSGGVTSHLLERLLEDQRRRAKHERKMSFAEKLRILDRLMTDGEPVVEDAIEKP